MSETSDWKILLLQPFKKNSFIQSSYPKMNRGCILADCCSLINVYFYRSPIILTSNKYHIMIQITVRSTTIGFTLLYFKMAVMPLVPETKMANIGKLISLRNLLVRKVTWLVLTTTSTTLILSCAFGTNCMTRIAYIYSCLPRTHSFHLALQRQHTHSLSHLHFDF